MEYTAKEVAEILNKEGFDDIKTRTVNYYAFEKKMFDVSGRGKKCFTKDDIEKIRNIKKLQGSTSFTLDQIKDLINDEHYEDSLLRYNPTSYRSVEDFKTAELLNEDMYINNIKVIDNNLCLSSFNGDSCQRTEEICASNNYNDLSKQRTLRINDDIMLILSKRITSDETSEIVKQINKIVKK